MLFQLISFTVVPTKHYLYILIWPVSCSGIWSMIVYWASPFFITNIMPFQHTWGKRVAHVTYFGWPIRSHYRYLLGYEIMQSWVQLWLSNCTVKSSTKTWKVKLKAGMYCLFMGKCSNRTIMITFEWKLIIFDLSNWPVFNIYTRTFWKLLIICLEPILT